MNNKDLRLESVTDRFIEQHYTNESKLKIEIGYFFETNLISRTFCYNGIDELKSALKDIYSFRNPQIKFNNEFTIGKGLITQIWINIDQNSINLILPETVLEI